LLKFYDFIFASLRLCIKLFCLGYRKKKRPRYRCSEGVVKQTAGKT
jgi:hypothetical protein